ncbi:MAG TPA: signal peptidase I [Thermodesulfovibrionales bacterium]|nr:signal peptidase I [Thermodesulfovibrionales bacterium]
MKDKKSLIREYIEAILIALLLALFIRAYIIQAFKIPSGSMIPTLLVGDHILVNKFIYGTNVPFSDKHFLVLKRPEKGDIIVFKYPEDPKKDFIKRVIATEGDLLESKDKVIYVNGKTVMEPYTYHSDRNIRPRGNDVRDNFGPLVVPPDKIFAMGDNRDQSYDSRYWGFVDAKDVKGEALIIYWSWDPKHWLRFNRTGRLVK